MDKLTIINYLQKRVNVKENGLKLMDNRYKIPKKIKLEIKELKAMIEYLQEDSCGNCRYDYWEED